MTDIKMSFKDALIAHLNGEEVETRSTIYPTPIGCENPWVSFIKVFGCARLDMIQNMPEQSAHQFRIKPRTVLCNGVEVPAPESVAPQYGWVVHYPNHMSITGHDCTRWGDESWLVLLLDRGLVYLNKEDAIERAKAMLITK